MPSNQKTYTITINGVTKALRDVDELQAALEDIQQNLGSISNEDINIHVNSEGLNEASEAIDEMRESANQLGNALKSTFTVDIDGVATDFDNITQAIGFLDDRAQGLNATLQEMRELNQDNTEEYDRLERKFREYINQSARLERARLASDELRDSLASQSRQLDLAVQGFTAVGNAMQMASGIMGLFGTESEEMTESINRTVQIMAVLQAAQELYNQTVTRGTFLNTTWNAAMKGSAAIMSALGIATTSASVAMRALQAAIAATGIGLLVVGVGELVGWLMRLSQSSSDATENINTIFDLVDRRLDNTKQELEKGVNLGLINDFQRLLTLIEQTDAAIQRVKASASNSEGTIGNILNQVSSSHQERLNEGTFNDENQIQHYESLIMKLQNTSNYATMSLEELGRILNEVGKGINEFDASKLEIDYLNDDENEKLRDFYNAQKEYINDIYNYRIELAEKNYQNAEVLDELQYENVKKTLSQELEATRKHYEELRKEYLLDFNTKKQLQEMASKGDTTAQLTLTQDESFQLNIDAAEQRAYDKIIKEHYQEQVKLQDELNSMRLESMREGLDKELAQLNQSYNERMHELQAREEDTTELQKQLIKNREAEIQRLNEQYQEQRLESLRQFQNELNQVYSDIQAEEQRYAIQAANSRFEKQRDDLAYNIQPLALNELDFGDFDIKEYFDTSELENALKGNISSIRSYYSEFTSLAREQAERIKQINLEALDYEYDANVSSENERYEQSLKELKDSLDKQIITRDDYNRLIEQAESAHNARLLQLQRNYNQDAEKLQSDLNDKITSLNAEQYSSEIKALQNQLSELNKLRGESSQRLNIGDMNLNVLGNQFLDISNMERFKDSYKQMAAEIENEMSQLTQKFQNGEISFDDFTKMKDELSSLQQSTQQALSATQMDWKGWASSIANIGSAAIGMFTQLYSSIANMQYQNEMARIERERELLDEELEMLEEQYQKQQEVYQNHTNNINSIEDELQTARGDRRTFLLDELTKEQAAQERAYAAQQKIERQKQQNEKKQQQLEKQQQAAEKARNNAQKKIQIMQATANTALAVTNALAVKPWFLGVALAAVAAAMGAAQIAIISRTQYKDGGLLKGKSHQEGGIPVGKTGIEVEGNEYIINRQTTLQNLQLMDFINSKRRRLNINDFERYFSSNSKLNKQQSKSNKLEQGGTLNNPNINLRREVERVRQDERPIYVSVTEIERVQRNLNNVRVVANAEE